ncbi:TRAP transporter, 4TM/12TM fusion family protein [Neorickettsia helminthoeca str. Oregon]|uniref:TRAP transporter, 4TM/12TM fusion family protein n=1 Tax=Neorickettsia helminthoeca str. Oregon TaxID=1286528 RepID=X5GXE6_9RICK|nr:TRAP transporter permease [Neorickettsia helminthoeca]AHX11727.1 TRAP transporter, 4TM/12TM fusion family protein [Neorickettsia helminthoeca str. Oregon]
MVRKEDYEHLTESELGSRPPKGTFLHSFISAVALTWALLQIWIASPMQFHFAEFIGSNAFILNDFQIRSIHLAFGLFLALSMFPAFSSSAKKYIPLPDWLLSGVGVFATFYLVFSYRQISLRLGMPTTMDVLVAVCGICVLLEAARRTVGSAVVIVVLVSLFYSRFGEIMPDLVVHKDYMLSAIASHQWFSTEGVFGTAIAVSVDFVFLYVLFGALLEKTGAGHFFIELSFLLLNRFRGGPAKAAVVSSGLMGMISGSSIANTITVGSLTIPMMKKMGFSPEKAAAIEVSAGINGQIMPPVMGAAAFLMAEYLSIPYIEVVKHAFLPAVLVYIALLYIVHIEACKLNAPVVVVSEGGSGGISSVILRMLLAFSVIALCFSGIYALIEGFMVFSGLKNISGTYGPLVIGGLCCFIYVALLWYQNTLKNNPSLDKSTVSFKLRTGLHHFMPLVILIWCLLVEHMSPALSAYWTILFLLFELFTKEVILGFFECRFAFCSLIKSGCMKCIDAMIMSSKNMTVVAVATAAAGIIVGSVSLTGVGLKIGGVLDSVSNGNLLVTLFLTAFMCMVLGMGMPTTACYIIVSTLMVPVLLHITKKNGIDIPLFSIHLFVFYFGLMADVTPPVGLASYAAAAIAGGNAIMTGVQAFFYNIRTMLLPFLFVLNPQILGFNIEGVAHLIQVIVFSVIGIIAITAGSQGYLIVRSKFYESIILFLTGIALMTPSVFVELVTKEFSNLEMNSAILSHFNDSKRLRIVLNDKDFFGNPEITKFNIDNKTSGTIDEQLRACGIVTDYDHDENVLDILSVSHSPVSRCTKLDSTMKISEIMVSQPQMPRWVVYSVSLLLFSCIFMVQRKRDREN